MSGYCLQLDIMKRGKDLKTYSNIVCCEIECLIPVCKRIVKSADERCYYDATAFMSLSETQRQRHESHDEGCGTFSLEVEIWFHIITPARFGMKT